MQVVTTVGLDIAKSVFQVHGVDAAGQVVTSLAANASHGLELMRDENWKASKVSIGPPYILDEAATHGIADEYEYDRYGSRFLLHNLRNEIGATRNYVWGQTDQLFGENSMPRDRLSLQRFPEPLSARFAGRLQRR